MPFGIGIWEMLILLLVLLLVFGRKRLPEMGRQIGKGMREFKDSVTGESDNDVTAVALGLPSRSSLSFLLLRPPLSCASGTVSRSR